VLLLFLPVFANADLRDLVPEETLKQVAEETSGEAARRNLDAITLQHRMRASRQFEVATQHIYEQLKHYGLDDVQILRFAADGKTMFGTQKSRPVWDVRFAELWELEEVDGETRRLRRLGDWESVPLTLPRTACRAMSRRRSSTLEQVLRKPTTRANRSPASSY
jgi:hypothetical protein